MTGKEFAEKCKQVATQYKTLYVLGCFGAPLTPESKARWQKAYEYNRREDRDKVIQAATKNTFGFDCVCLLKAILWGWNGDAAKPYGGAAYGSNGVPDIDEGTMISRCKEASTDFDHLEIGEVVWLPGHIGVYIGDGLAVECTPKWDDGVQITACNRDRKGYNRRNWTKHGKLPYVTYEAPAAKPSAPSANAGMKLPEIQRGSKGASVKAMQLLLTGYGYPCGTYGADGDFGPATAEAVKAFQGAKGLGKDGICGVRTWGALLGL